MLSFLDSSELFNLFRIAINDRVTNFNQLVFENRPRFKKWTDEFKNFEHNLKMMVALSYAGGSQWVVLARQVNGGPIDKKLEKLNTVTKRVAQSVKLKALYFDTKQLCPFDDNKDFVTPIDAHFTESGHEKFARCLFEFGQQNRLFGKVRAGE